MSLKDVTPVTFYALLMSSLVIPFCFPLYKIYHLYTWNINWPCGSVNFESNSGLLVQI